MVVGQLSSRTGCRMVDKKDSSFRVVDSIQVGLVELPQCQGAGAILDKDQVYPGNNDIAGTGLGIELGSEDFLG